MPDAAELRARIGRLERDISEMTQRVADNQAHLRDLKQRLSAISASGEADDIDLVRADRNRKVRRTSKLHKIMELARSSNGQISIESARSSFGREYIDQHTLPDIRNGALPELEEAGADLALTDVGWRYLARADQLPGNSGKN